MGIANLTDSEEVEHLLVLKKLGFLELVNRQLTMVDRDEVDQLAVVFDVHVHLFDVGLIVQNIFFNSSLRFEETLESGLSESHLVKLFLLITNLFLSLELLLNDAITTIHCIHHSTYVEKFSLDPDPGLSEWVFPRLDGFVNVRGQLRSSGVGHDSQATVTIAIVIDCSLFKLDECRVDALIVVVGFVLGAGILFELLLLFLKRNDSFSEECLENVDLVLVTSELRRWLIFVNLEV